jgi:hypothetical protein
VQNEFEDSKNESAASSFLHIIGRMGTNRLMLELLDDVKNKADSIKFENNHIFTKKFLACKSKGIFFKLTANIFLYAFSICSTNVLLYSYCNFENFIYA